LRRRLAERVHRFGQTVGHFSGLTVGHTT
jgi:hypothetical protein